MGNETASGVDGERLARVETTVGHISEQLSQLIELAAVMARMQQIQTQHANDQQRAFGDIAALRTKVETENQKLHERITRVKDEVRKWVYIISGLIIGVSVAWGIFAWLFKAELINAIAAGAAAGMK